ncbi:SDR family NAD(P)-dependent oxidoreductase [Cryptosporangium arvum]|uniref:Zn-dependent oxidoreductase, NADPH:quinone reductase n=1 Tax=Cryptosporangium arvum DSM 44712 TaxID=927661 RepID=A0A011AJF7_9ACTN|nr:SDR family NAD(P)-dependent oxidoreductase [Cryptosporangium arvum]EXG82151.1 Zn-dependent oxidoreductase, NADPH:quinone reductase [Cryptosporangium arvum DSM 44712]
MTTPADEAAGVLHASRKETERPRRYGVSRAVTGAPVTRTPRRPGPAPELLRVRWVEVRGSGAGFPAGFRTGFVTAAGALPEPAGGRVPDLVVVETDESCDASGVCARVLGPLRAFLSDRRYTGSRLAVVTRLGVAVEPGAPVNVAVAAAWGLVRAAQNEHPGRVVLVDVEADEPALLSVLAAVTATGEAQAAVRGGSVLVPRLEALDDGGGLLPPPGATPWRLTRGGDGLTLLPCPQVGAPLTGRQVRISVRAGGVNPSDASGRFRNLGREAAGIVLDVGPEVAGLRPGDRVTGLADACFGPVALSSEPLLLPVPEDWTFEQAATVPVAFLTAYYALADVAPGASVLVRDGAGGAGTAAIQLAQHLGADVYVTAAESTWDVLRDLGLPDDRIAVRWPTTRFDVVFENRYFDAGPDIVSAMLAELAELFAAGVLDPLPVTAFDVRRARDALWHLSRGEHTGKVVLTIPHGWDTDRTVLVTGGTGHLGRDIARYLVTARGTRRLVLAGPAAPGTDALRRELTASGARVDVVVCDVADRRALSALLTTHPVDAVVHVAGPLDGGAVGSLTPDELGSALRAKLDVAWHLHELVGDAPLVVLSSPAGLLGTPGRGADAAASAGLDALMHQRQRLGLPGLSLAWESGETALRLFDLAIGSDEALIAPFRVDAWADLPVPPLFDRLV